MGDGAVVLPVARTNAEAHLFMDLHPCGCGQAGFPRASSVVQYGDDLASRYHGRCAGCGADREFVFRLPPEIMLPVGGQVRYGGDEPSELIDAGEWLWVADRYARAVPGNFAESTGADRKRMRTWLATAMAALDEVGKFVSAGLRPAEALWTARGRAMYDAEPGRFDQARLAAVRQVYREALARLD